MFITLWHSTQGSGQAQTFKESGGASALGGQMLISPLFSSSMINFPHVTGAYSLGGLSEGGPYLPGLSGSQLSIGGGSFMSLGGGIGLLGSGSTLLNLGGGGINAISLPIGLSHPSSINFPQNINSLYGFYGSPYNVSRPTYFSGGNPFGSSFGMVPSGIGGGMSPWGGTSYGYPYGMGGGMPQVGGTFYGGYPSFSAGGNYYSNTTPYNTFYGGSYYDRFAGWNTGTNTSTYPYGLFSGQMSLGYITVPSYSLSSGYISGMVTIKNQGPLGGAEIIIKSAYIERSYTTKADGSYTTYPFPGGAYSVTVFWGGVLLDTTNIFINTTSLR